MKEDGRHDGKMSERRLLLKIDLLLMPLMTIAYGLQFYDKAILGSASIFGILNDLDLKTMSNGQTSLTRYSTATSAFYWGYLVAALPMALLVQRFKPSILLGTAIMVWGSILLLTPAVTSWRGLIAQRFFLGFVESSISPGFVLITKMWYKREEQPVRLGIWYSATGLFSIFSGLVNYGLGTAAKTSPSPWKYMFVFAGGFTVVFGMLLLVLLPASPAAYPLLAINHYNTFDEQERLLAAQRVRSNLTGEVAIVEKTAELDNVDISRTDAVGSFAGSGKPWQWYQAREALLDYKIWIFFLQAICIYICNGGVTAFGAYIISSFGYTPLRSIILQTPGGATTAVSIYISTYIARRVPNSRSVLLVFTCLPVIAGAAMVWKGNWENRAVPLAGYYLLPIFGAPFVLMLSLSTANIAGSTKQSICAALIFIGYNVGNIATSYITKANQAPIHFRDTFLAIIICMAITIVLTAILAFGMAMQNRARHTTEGEQISSPRSQGLLDLTDMENKSFHYVF